MIVKSHISCLLTMGLSIKETDFIQYLVVKKSLSDQSVRHARIRLGIISRWLTEQELDLTKETVEKFLFHLRKKGLGNNTLNTYLFTLRMMKDYLVDRGESGDFLDGFKSFKKTRPVIKILTPNEIEKILAVRVPYTKFQGKDISGLDFKFRCLTTFLAHTGSRFSETILLRVKNLDLAAGKAHYTPETTKTSEANSVFLSEPLIGMLKELIAGKNPNDLVFTNAANNQVNPQDFALDLKRRSELAGIAPTKRVYPHLFRHSMATQLLMSGVAIEVVASILGHKDIQTGFQNYAHLADDSKKNAMHKHPLIRKSIDPKEILKQAKELFASLALDQDGRFDFVMNETANALSFSIAIK